MLECLILGDSIAKGISQFRKECAAYVEVGANSRGWNNRFISKVAPNPAKTVIISLGSNDYEQLNTEVELLALRSRVNSDNVYWIVPAINPAKQEIVKNIASQFGDAYVILTKLSPDKIHPTSQGYKALGDMLK
jgi:heptaprenylglyceryl phosphate synthase